MKSKRWTGLTYPSARALGSNGRRPPEGKNRKAFFSPPAWETTIAGVGLIGPGAGKRGEALLLPPRTPFLDGAAGSMQNVHADRCACLTPTVALVLPEFYGSQRRFCRSVGLRLGTGVPAGENGRLTFHRKVADFRLRPDFPQHARGGHENRQGGHDVVWHGLSPLCLKREKDTARRTRANRCATDRSRVG